MGNFPYPFVLYSGMIATHQDRVQAQPVEYQEMVNSVHDNHPNYHTDAFGSKAETCQIAMWAYAAHPCGYFSFTRKVSKSVSKGIPLRYPLGASPPQWSLDHAPPYLSQKFHDSPGGSKGELPLLLEIQKPGGFWCIFAYFLYIRK